MKKILIVFGTRPEAIKMAPLVKIFSCYKNDFHIRVCVTAQHRQMLDQVLEFFDIQPDYDLNLMKPGQSLNGLWADILVGMKSVLEDFMPDYVLVHGDTATSSAAALAAYFARCRVCHVEAGLRTYNKWAPFPEEMNRLITSKIADIHFAPTEKAAQNLLREGIGSDRIMVTGNTVIDALKESVLKIENGYVNEEIEYLKKILDPDRQTILVTGHRRENFGQGFVDICYALKELVESRSDIQMIYPVHLNPSVQKPVSEILGKVRNVHLVTPLSYPAFVWMMNNSRIIITDSGGVQEEAPSLGKPVLVMRDTTERPEAVEAGTVVLVGTDRNKIVNESIALLDDTERYEAMSRVKNPYGDGLAGRRIVDFLMRCEYV